MGGTLNHPTPQNLSEWMRLIERRVLTQERREPQFGILQRLGPGLSKYAHRVVDWNTENTWLAGQFWSGIESLHSPDETKEWIGFTKVAADRGGVQEIISMDGSIRKQRPFTFNNPDGLPTFGEWTDIGSGSGGGPPTGAAGGDLTGFYPAPEIAAGVVGNAELAPNSVTTDKIVDGTITASDLAPGTIPAPVVVQDENVTVVSPATLLDFQGAGVTVTPGAAGEAIIAIAGGSGGGAPTGPAGGDLTGTYPNPQLAAGSVGSAEIADGSITAGDLAPGTIPTVPTTLPPSGPAGGGLAGTYPNPTIATGAVGSAQVVDGSLTAADLAPGTIPTTLPGPPTGPAGGDLTGTYPNPEIGAGKVGSAEIADASIQAGDIAPGVIPTVPTTLPPSGAAGGDLGGTYPDPTVLKARSGFTVGTPGNVAGAMSATDALFVGVNGLTESIRARLAGDTQNRWHMTAGGVLNFGSGSATPDVNLYRTVADTLRTDDALSVGGQLDLNTNKLVNLAPGTVGTDGVNKTQLDAKTATGAAGGDLTGTYPNPDIGAGKVGNAELAADAVTTDKIQNGTITAADLAPGVLPPSPTKHANPGFDGVWVANAHGARPPSWDDFYMAAGIVANAYDTTDFIGGGGSARITQPATGAIVNTRIMNTDAFGVQPGDTLTVSVWAKTNLPSPTLNIFLNTGVTAATAAPLAGGNQQSRPFPITTGWVQYSASFTIPTGDLFARISFVGDAIGAGSWWLDESSSSSVSPPPATGLVPTGAVTPYAGSGANPTGWLDCDGTAVNRTTYAALFAAIGTTYGTGNGTTTFNLPNMQGKVPAGLYAPDPDFNALAKSGGEKTHTLTVAEMPSHNHPAAVKQAYVAGGNVAKQGASTAVDWTIPARVDTIENAGGGGAHNVMQPYLTLRFIIKT